MSKNEKEMFEFEMDLENFFFCLRSNLSKDNINFCLKARGPFLESPGNFLGPKSNIQIQI